MIVIRIRASTKEFARTVLTASRVCVWMDSQDMIVVVMGIIVTLTRVRTVELVPTDFYFLTARVQMDFSYQYAKITAHPTRV